jgi:hypothetical protein
MRTKARLCGFHSQILGQLIGGNQTKAGQVLGHFKAAAAKAQDDAAIWEVLGELSASNDPSGRMSCHDVMPIRL